MGRRFEDLPRWLRLCGSRNSTTWGVKARFLTTKNSHLFHLTRPTTSVRIRIEIWIEGARGDTRGTSSSSWGSRRSCWSSTSSVWLRPSVDRLCNIFSRAQYYAMVNHRRTADLNEASAVAEEAVSTNSTMLDLVFMCYARIHLTKQGTRSNRNALLRVDSASTEHLLTSCRLKESKVHWTAATAVGISLSPPAMPIGFLGGF